MKGAVMFGDLFTPMHMLFVLIVVLVIFGPKRLPELGRSLGKGIQEFKKSTSELQEHLNVDENKADAPPKPQEKVSAETTHQSPPEATKS